MPETRPQPIYELYDQGYDAQHEWVDITTLDSPDNTWICAGCGLTRTEPRTHWPLYPYREGD